MRPTIPMEPVPEHAPVQRGCRVRLSDVEGEEEYVLVSRASADPAQGRLSEESPVGRAVLGRRCGEEVKVLTPGGVRLLTIVDLTPGGEPPDGAGWDACAP
jgi:transcription elongation factor GreA